MQLDRRKKCFGERKKVFWGIIGGVINNKKIKNISRAMYLSIDAPDASRKVQRRYHASSANFRAAAEILLVELLLFDAYTRRELERGPHPAQSKLLVLLYDLLMRVLLLDRVGRLYRFYARQREGVYTRQSEEDILREANITYYCALSTWSWSWPESWVGKAPD